MFIFTKTNIDGLIIIDPQVFGDERGFFMETYSKKEFSDNGINVDFVQDNHSKSSKGVLRGLHFQTINTQSKLVRVISGSVYDVAVDLRKGSPTYGKWYGVILSAKNKKQFFIPQGFAHGFLTLEDNTEFVYKCDDFYNPVGDGGISYNSPKININWGDFFDVNKLIISEKDKKHPNFDIKNFYFGYKELTENIYAYIDTQNIFKSLQREGFQIDWKKFFIYLKNKFKIKKAYLFLGYLKENERFYKKLKEWGYELIFREIGNINGTIKGNIDTEFTLQVISEINIFNKALLVTSDGDFVSLVKKLGENGKLLKVISPTYNHCSNLLKKEAKEKMFYLSTDLKKFTNKIEK